MNDKTLYLKWLSWLCLLMAIFGIMVFIIGYKDFSVGRVATVGALLAAFAILQVVYRRLDHGSRP
ncbi:MAG: hypothetical protein HFJ66_08500 [Eggerthellaceae bacterium]|nr:hypothetical protein [Eggerthellaceae bacterium]